MTQNLPSATGRYPVAAQKSPGVAVLLSLLWLGAGHLYADKIGVGIALIIFDTILALLALTGIGLIIAIPLWLISAPVVMGFAVAAANRFNRRQLAPAA